MLFTDYLDFRLYRDGQLVTKIAIAQLQHGSIVPLPQNFAAFTNLIKDFTTHISQTIESARKLAEMMAGKARLLSDVIEKVLTSDEANDENNTLKEQMHAFKQILIHDITPKDLPMYMRRPLLTACLRHACTILHCHVKSHSSGGEHIENKYCFRVQHVTIIDGTILPKKYKLF